MLQKIKTILIVIVIAIISGYIGYINIKIVQQDELITYQENELIKCSHLVVKSNETLFAAKEMLLTSNKLCYEQRIAEKEINNILNNGVKNEKTDNGSDEEIYTLSKDSSRELIDYINTIFYRLR